MDVKIKNETLRVELTMTNDELVNILDAIDMLFAEKIDKIEKYNPIFNLKNAIVGAMIQ